MVASDVSVPGGIYCDGLTRVVTVCWTIVMPNPKLISVRCIFDCGDVVVRTGFYTLTSHINVA